MGQRKVHHFNLLFFNFPFPTLWRRSQSLKPKILKSQLVEYGKISSEKTNRTSPLPSPPWKINHPLSPHKLPLPLKNKYGKLSVTSCVWSNNLYNPVSYKINFSTFTYYTYALPIFLSLQINFTPKHTLFFDTLYKTTIFQNWCWVTSVTRLISLCKFLGLPYVKCESKMVKTLKTTLLSM